MNNLDRFSQALCNLTNTEQEHFWQWIAKAAKNLSDKAKLRSGLCNAIGELRRGRNQPRTFAGGFRSLSRDQLHKAVLAHRERLIPFVKEHRDWKAMVAGWFLDTRQAQVVTVLDALGCLHDGKGNCLEDRPPHLEPKEAMQRIITLSSQIPFTDLEMITAGLLSNHEDWNYLDQTVDWLHEKVQRDRKTVQTTGQCPVPITTMTATQFSTDPATRLQALRIQMDTLITSLQGMVAELQAGQLPDITVIANVAEPLQMEFNALVTELRPVEKSLEGLKAALHAQGEQDIALTMLSRLERLRHRQNPAFVGIVQIQQRCTEIRQMMIEATGLDEVITKALRPLQALERLVNEYENLDEVVVEELDTTIRGQFGAHIAIAVSKRNLEFSEPGAMVPAKPGESGDLTEDTKHREDLNEHHDPLLQIEEVSSDLPELEPCCQSDRKEAIPATQPDQNTLELDAIPAALATVMPHLEDLNTNGIGQQGHVAGETPPTIEVETPTDPRIAEYGTTSKLPVATLLRADLASLKREDWVRLGKIQYFWLERRQPLRAWLLAREIERRLFSLQIHIEDLPLLPPWACRLLLVTSDEKLPLSDEDKELLYRIRNLSSDNKELIVLWITAALLENATDKPLRIIRLVSPQQFDLSPHSLGSACVEQLLTPVFNGGLLRPLRDPADIKREFDQAIQDAQEILNPKRNNYSNRWVRNFWRDLITGTGRMGQILTDARECRFSAQTLSVEVIVEDIPEWSNIKSAYRNNMHNRMEEFANRIEAARSAHQATQVLKAGQSAISKQAIAEIQGGIQRQTGNAWWLKIIESSVVHL